MRTARILFCCRPLSGHFDPMVPLATAARAAGHIVGFASGDPVIGRAREAGFRVFRVGRADTFRAEWAPMFPGFMTLVGDAQREFFFTEVFANLELVPRAADLEVVMEAWQPNLVVHELAELAAPLVSSAFGIPYVDVGYGPMVPRALLEAAGTAAAPHWRARGLQPDPLAGTYRHLYIDPCPPALQSPEIADVPKVQRMQPFAVPRTNEHRTAWFDGLPARPTVYVTLGTIWNTNLDVFRLIIGALADRVNLIVTIGRQNEPRKLGPQPETVIVRSFIPQHEVLPWCDAVISHGGAGTMLGALAYGVPMLVVPQGADQWHNAERVVASGAGRQLLRDQLTAEAVGDELSELLTNPSYRQAATMIQQEISDMPSTAAAVAGLESLL